MLSILTGGALVIAGHAAQMLLSYLLTPKAANPAAPTSDPLAGLPGLPGHPVLNQLLARFNVKQAQSQSDIEAALLQEVLKDIAAAASAHAGK